MSGPGMKEEKRRCMNYCMDGQAQKEELWVAIHWRLYPEMTPLGTHSVAFSRGAVGSIVSNSGIHFSSSAVAAAYE